MTHPVVRLDRFEEYLKEQNLSRTRPRRLVYRALALGGPQSAPQLVASLNAQVDRATVYRTIEFFLANHIAVRSGTNIELGEAFRPHHHHLVCTHCDKSISIDDQALEKALSQIAESHGYLLQAHQVELDGLCGECRSRLA